MFHPANFEAAKDMVVGNCNGLGKDERWREETPVFVDIIGKEIEKTIEEVRERTKEEIILLDYGCGNGRIAKELIEKYRNIEIEGVDSSKEMRDLSVNYVLSERYKAFAPSWLHQLVGIHYDFVYAIYCFQHIPLLPLLDAIDAISLLTDKLLLVNSVCRMAVIDNKFTEDGVNVLSLVRRRFPQVRAALDWQVIVDNPVIRKMFLEGGTLHYAVWCEK